MGNLPNLNLLFVLQKMLEKQKLMKWWSIINPTKHIKDVYSVDEITF